MREVLGHTQYKGYTAQQHYDAFDVFKPFISEIKPKRILEIGTAGGGFTLFLRDTLDEIGLTY
jgi:cephalosporin hydroxylase